jgi:hypothetical protein
VALRVNGGLVALVSLLRKTPDSIRCNAAGAIMNCTAHGALEVVRFRADHMH